MLTVFEWYFIKQMECPEVNIDVINVQYWLAGNDFILVADTALNLKAKKEL